MAEVTSPMMLDSTGQAIVEALEAMVLQKQAVLYAPQTLTDAQKQQARENIGAGDDTPVAWGNIDGDITEQEDLKTALDGITDSIPAQVSDLENDAGYLKQPSSGLAVGKFFRIASIDEKGHVVLEVADGGSAAETEYDNTESELESDNVQDAVDELKVLNDGKQSTALTATVTIAVADWEGGTTVTKNVTGVTATNIVFCDSSDPDVQCTAQGASTLTFTASATPSTNVTVKVVILP